ncbi:hypothetical protein ILUMI_07944 [Ignelater luminosus]|uniref:Polynucleotide 5'-hydroxyl-kinase NOL9 n=1 Tax=Ignelater luminosus TaxID=2038154 RepID=A0A8K0GGD8_IGNLU|nr:hypothetical protein ILUMI_07944 [Ignelater luminosus]
MKNRTRRKPNEHNKKILKWPDTPYRYSKEMVLKAEKESSALFNRNSEYDDIEVTPMELDNLQVSTSAIPKSLIEDKSQGNVPKINRSKSKAATVTDVGDEICDDNNKENLPSLDKSFMRKDSHVKIIDEVIVLDTTSDSSSAFACDIENAMVLDNEIDMVLDEDHTILTVEDAPTRKYRCVSLNDTLLLELHENTKLYFYGLMSVTVLQGEVQTCGYTLTPSLEDVELYSPRGWAFLFFETKDFTTPVRPDLLNILCTLQMEIEDAEEFCSSLLPSSSVILCKRIVKNHFEFLQKHISQQIFLKCEYPIPQCVFQNAIGNWNVLKIPTKWNQLIDLMQPSSKTLLCGGKHVGKSTMLRYLINQLIMKHSEVLVIDLDPGQPEFTIPGCVSATVVKEPIFGPNYTHLKKPIRCLFLPCIEVALEPCTYLTAVRELIHSCDDYCKGPILINYVSFTRSIHLEIFAAAVTHVKPNTIIEMYDARKRQDFREVLSHQLIVEKSKLFARNMNAPPKFDSFRVECATDCSRGWHLEEGQIREMCILSYLGQMLPEGVLSLTATTVPVFRVDLSQVNLIRNGKIVLPFTVNASLVALCSSNDIYSSYTCHGWGVVRAVNLSNNELYLLTPLSPEKLQNVNNLILSSVTLPPSLYMTADNKRGFVPYVSQRKDS